MASDEPESVMPTGGDPLTDPMPPAPAPSGWVTPWDTPPPPVDAPASEVPEPATGDDDLAMTQQMPPLDDPMADDAMADDAMADDAMADDAMADDAMADERVADDGRRAPAAPLDEPVTEFAAPYAPAAAGRRRAARRPPAPAAAGRFVGAGRWQLPASAAGHARPGRLRTAARSRRPVG